MPFFEEGLKTGTYPSMWKKVNVIPNHKKDSRSCRTNFRPISLLPVIRKLFEKVKYDLIYSHLRNSRLSGDSTISQLLLVAHDIYGSFDNFLSLETRAVFLDLSKAFDKVWHDGLLYKLEFNRISTELLNQMGKML